MSISRTWLTALVGLALTACATVEIPREKSYPDGWPAIVSPGSECRGIEGTYENAGKGVRADASGEPRSIWFTDLFQQYGVWVRERSGLPATEVVKEDFHACDRVTIRIESVPRSESPLANLSLFRMTLNASRPIGSESSSKRVPCTTLTVPKARGYAGPLGPGYLFCRATSLSYHGEAGGVNSFDLHLAPAADGSLVIFKSEQILPEATWARFLKLPE